MVAQEKIKEEKILKISKIYQDCFIVTNNNEYHIPIEIIENYYKRRNDKTMFVDMSDKNYKMFKVKNKK